MELLHTIKSFKEFNEGVYYHVVDNNDWVWPILSWHNDQKTQPTQAELETAWVEVEKKTKAWRNRE